MAPTNWVQIGMAGWNDIYAWGEKKWARSASSETIPAPSGSEEVALKKEAPIATDINGDGYTDIVVMGTEDPITPWVYFGSKDKALAALPVAYDPLFPDDSAAWIETVVSNITDSSGAS